MSLFGSLTRALSTLNGKYKELMIAGERYRKDFKVAVVKQNTYEGYQLADVL